MLNYAAAGEVGVGLFGNFFGGRRRKPNFSPEVVEKFEKIKHFLVDDDAQNAALPEQARKVIEAGLAVDELPDAKGKFGQCVTNPVPVNGVVGELTYLSALVTPSGAGLFGHRLGHIDRVDVYETVSTDGRAWDILFLSYYHPRKSRKAPSDYRLLKVDERPIFITCTNFRVDGFPLPMEAAIRGCMRRVLGFPLRPPDVAELLTSARFIRTSDQNARLAKLADLGMEPAANYKDIGD